MISTIFQAVPAAAVEQQEMTESLFSMATKGGWLMLVLLLLSLVAIYIFAKKCIIYRKLGSVDKAFFLEVTGLLKEGKKNAAIARCESAATPAGKILAKGMENTGRSDTDLRSAMENAASLEVANLEKGLPALSTIAGGAPMIGFLGTVIGMIQAFFNMSQAGNNIDITLLSGGIYTAMITTVGGLVVGILAYFAYNYLTARISSIVSSYQGLVDDFVDFNRKAE